MSTSLVHPYSRSLTFVAAAFCVAATGCGEDSAQVPARSAEVPPSSTAQAVANDPPNGATPDPAVATQGMSIGPAQTAAELVRAVLRLTQASARVGIAATSTDGVMFQLVLPPEADAARASAIARTLGNVTTASIVWPPAEPIYTLELLNVRNGVPLQDGPSSNANTLAILPDGTLFVAFEGPFAGGPSAREGEGAWVYGQDSSGRAGWVRGATTALEEGCVLDPDALAGALSVRLDDDQLRLALLGNIALYRGGQRKRGTFVVAPTYVALIERPSNCRQPQLDSRIEVEGPVEELHHARDREDGDTFLAIATSGDGDNGDAEWSFYPPRATEASVTRSLATHWLVPSRQRAQVRIAPRRGPGNARGYWAFSVKSPGTDAVFYTSDGTSFTEFAPAAPAAPAAPTVP